MTNDATRLTERLAQFASNTTYDDLPPNVIRECKRLLLDTIGCALGAINTESGRIALQYGRILGGEPAATVLGLDARSSATTASYVNARLANVLDADDTFPTSTHFGNATIFASLALAEQFERSGRDLLTAIAVGFDVGARVGSWMGAPMQIKDGKVVGWNELGGPAATITWAAVGSAVSIGGLDARQANHAFGIAGSNSPLPTLRKWAESPEQPMYKYADTGWCAEVGVSAVLLAGLGSTGFLDILDGPNAFWRFYGSPSHDDAVLLRGLGSDWQILNTTYKPWPCCRWIHHPLTAFARLRKQHDLQPDEIDRIVVRANPFALTPIFQQRQPASALSAEFSHAHAMAVLAHDVPAGPLWYTDETLQAPHIVAFRNKVSVEPEVSSANIATWMQGGQWRGVPGGVDVHARDTIFSATAEMSTGDPWSPETLYTDAEILAKFRVMVGLETDGSGPDPVVAQAADELAAAIDALETKHLTSLTVPLSRLASALRRT